ncbi:MAG: methyl-accepting chemotaxis protein [Mariprofundaceae bacterium]|nr:methyl-accepting chemotaxis protein [Mariprofundaceae bacterium]
MKKNLPVTNNEVAMRDGQLIISTTNMKGIITEANEGFIDVSGFSRQELIGKNHNIIRHPDMPPSAFQWLWDSIRAGDPWTGLVKNRCKNGSFYWVQTNITPFIEKGEITGYVSVCTKPTQADVDDAAKLYATINAGGGMVLGKKTLLQKINVFSRMKVWHKIAATLLLTATLLAGSWLIALQGMGVSHSGLLMVGMPLLLGAIFAGLLIHSLTRRLRYTMKKLESIAEGNYFDWITLDSQDEIGLMQKSLKSMQIRNAYAEHQAGKRADEALRIKTALDNVQTPVQVTDVDYNIFYVNKAAKAMFQSHQDDFRKLLPDFCPSKVIGANVNTFYKSPAHQRQFLDGLHSNSTSDNLAFCDEFIVQVSASPILDEAGQQTGTILEWLDRSAEVGLEREVSDMMTALQKGNLSIRIDTEGKTGFFATLAEGLNNVTATLASTVSETITALKALEQGDLTHKITNEYEGVFDVIKQAANTTTAKLSRTLNDDIGPVLDAAKAGDLSRRVQTENYVGFYKQLGDATNDLLDKSEQAINDTVAGLKALERGDLTHEITNDYEGAFDTIKQASNNTAVKLAGMMKYIAGSAGEVGNGSSEIARGNAQLNDSTQEQAAALEEAAASIEEITGTIQQTADNSRQANQLVMEAHQQAENGSSVVDHATEAMSDINASSKKIAGIIGVVNKIACQINLLALNATTEAVREGEQGRGFAVVAGEVRSLAQRSAEAAKEIRGLINESVSSVEEGSKLVGKSGEALKSIVTSVQKVKDIVSEIAAASQEQASGVEQINKAIAQLNSGTQQNVAMGKDVSAASENLDAQAGDMRELIAVFNVGEGNISTKPFKVSERCGKKVVGMNKAAALLARKRSRAASRIAAKAVSKAAAQAKGKVEDEE